MTDSEKTENVYMLIRMIQKALKKQIPIDPFVTKDSDGNECKICRKCCEILEDGEWRAEYCPNCGQRVDWEVEECDTSN